MSYDPTYKPTPPNQYNQPQAILDSGRLLFNAKEDSILMFSSKAIGLSSVSSVNIDTGKMIVNADRIDLGLDADEPLLKGNKTTNFLNDILSVLDDIGNALEQAISTPPGSPISSLTIQGVKMKVDLSILKQKIEELKSKQNFTL
jgi:hypothetical protein